MIVCTVRSLVMVRNQLPAQGVKTTRNLVGRNTPCSVASLALLLSRRTRRVHAAVYTCARIYTRRQGSQVSLGPHWHNTFTDVTLHSKLLRCHTRIPPLLAHHPRVLSAIRRVVILDDGNDALVTDRIDISVLQLLIFLLLFLFFSFYFSLALSVSLKRTLKEPLFIMFLHC